MIRILLVEDEEHLQEAIKLNLELEGYKVVAVGNGIDAVKVFKQERFNLVVLDVMLPELDGFGVCEAIRLHNSSVPILFLSAKNTSEDKILGLKRGADDYMTKPFNLEEFLLRVHALVKRGLSLEEKKEMNDVFRFEGNEVNFLTFEILGKDKKQIRLTKKEIALLKLLIERRNEVVSREQILETVWGYDIYPSTRTVDNFILAFRKYFEVDPKIPQYFFSVRGVGYKFVCK
ncbi:MAG: response regulator transcription factor [Bacteroidetes bacterium]|jgi:two-component system alkaline phosphatase synthesis response regulator PhoP|nr:response regulator transcription factor [Bacteroidota bacterium]MBP6428284.1 response regulator transcription factor [Bacteroidia bacterium]MBK8362657.1 response regulator transcription factor [Bacteroidota bacterium]MBK9412634.1 response regulator transcription factor [Bacteroidota bacterium]MBL0032053.1 response regulator transcription factor [Bacteroidota bacterium]